MAGSCGDFHAVNIRCERMCECVCVCADARTRIQSGACICAYVDQRMYAQESL